MTINTTNVVYSGTITDGSALTKNILHHSPDGDEYCVDVLMDKLNHKDRTRLNDSDFYGNLYDTIQYALANSTCTTFKLECCDIARNGQIVTQYTVVLN